MSRRLIILSVAVVLVVLSIAVWKVARFPPVRLLLKYGLPSSMGRTGERITIEGVEFIEISPGYFLMGSEFLVKDEGDAIGRICQRLGLPWGDQPEPSNEMPLRWVEFENGFWMARTEITNEQYERFDPEHMRSKYGRGGRDPALEVTWEQAMRYSTWLSTRKILPVRLPTEAEWECACRAGSSKEYSFGSDAAKLRRHAWFTGNSTVCAHAVATRAASRWGFHDLHGNAREWCVDVYDLGGEDKPGTHTYLGQDGKLWSGASVRVVRGGGWPDSGEDCRSASRDRSHTKHHGLATGFRPAFVLTPEERKRVVGK